MHGGASVCHFLVAISVFVSVCAHISFIFIFVLAFLLFLSSWLARSRPGTLCSLFETQKNVVEVFCRRPIPELTTALRPVVFVGNEAAALDLLPCSASSQSVVLRAKMRPSVDRSRGGAVNDPGRSGPSLKRLHCGLAWLSLTGCAPCRGLPRV